MLQEKRRDVKHKKYNHWILEYNLFPFSKFQLITYPKRHLKSFAGLNRDELIELRLVYKEVHKSFLKSKVISNKSKYGDQLLTLFRERFDDAMHGKGKLAHFHIIFYPRFEMGKDIKIYKKAHIFDAEELLRTFKGL